MDEIDGYKDLVLYHKNCTDGHCAAWVTRKVLPNAVFMPVSHGQEPPDVKGKDVYILDFAYKRKTLLEMQKRAKSLVVIDHHKTAAADLEGLSFCVFDMSKSGATLAWEYFKKRLKGEMPWLVSYTEDRDLWKFDLPLSKEINAALDSYPFDFRMWDALERLYPSSNILNSPLVTEGRSILRFQDRLIDTILQHARTAELGGIKVKAANTSCIFEAANRLAQDAPVGVTWYLREDGMYVYSLRSTDEGMDVSELAGRFGGGGHPHSAGFTSSELVLKWVE